MPQKIYLDDNGNPIPSGKVYLDEQGNPIGRATPAQPEAKGYLRTAVDFVKQHPAEIGAIAGGIAAVPLTGGTSLLAGMAAAGLGGAGGAGLGMLAGAAADSPNLPNTAGGVIRTMGEQGATQAGAEAGGRAISGALKAGASRLYQSALAPTVALRSEYPNLVKTGLEQAVPVSKGGLEKAGALKGASMQQANDLVSAAAHQPNAATIDPTQAVGGITGAVQDARGLPVARPTMRAIGDYARSYLAEHPRPLTLTDAHEAVRATDRHFNSAYRATLDRGNPITSGQTAAAVGINDATRQLLRDAVPGLQAQNANTQALAGLEKGLERRTGNIGNWMPFGMRHAINAGLGVGAGEISGSRKGGAGTFLLLEALSNPNVASRLAIGAAKSAGAPYAQLIRAALLGQMIDDQPNHETTGR
jgi:hypothetical protein